MDELNYEKFIDKLEKISDLCGVPYENTGGGCLCFIVKVREGVELIFGYANGPLGFTLWDMEEGQDLETGEMEKDGDETSAEDQANFILETIKRIKK